MYHPQWSHCAIAEIDDGGVDQGPINSINCSINKTSPESALRVTFNGNIRLTDCHDCCMRWFMTIDGSECVTPAPIDGVLYTINAEIVNIHRGSTITGICSETVNGTIGVGLHDVTLNVGMCDGFNETYNAFTGFQSISTINIDEMPERESNYTSSWLHTCTCINPFYTHIHTHSTPCTPSCWLLPELDTMCHKRAPQF